MESKRYCRLLDVANARTGFFERQYLLRAVPLPEYVQLPAAFTNPRPTHVLTLETLVQAAGVPAEACIILLPFPAQVDVFTLLHFVTPAHCRLAYPLLQNRLLGNHLLTGEELLHRTHNLLHRILHDEFSQAHPLRPE